MRFSLSTAAALVMASCIAIAHASPVDPAQNVARSMMGRSNNLVAWGSQPMERSPADPERREAVAAAAQEDTNALEKRIVYNPPVTHPKHQTIWHAGQKQTVKWEVHQEDIPVQAKKFLVTVKLGYIRKDGEGGLNLKWTLAKDIPITSEEADIILPADLDTRDDYIVVVMGDSGNRSKKFTIRANSDAHPKVQCASGKREVSSEDVFAESLLGRDVAASA